MAKQVSLKIKLVSSAETGYFYITRKNTRPRAGGQLPEKISLRKYDPIARKHVLFNEAKIK